MTRIALADAGLFFTDEGTGPAALLMHGWSCDLHDWSLQVPALLDAGYRVIAPDHRGHGRSSAPRSSYRPQVLADDAAALLRALDIEEAVVLGHSMGTIVASALAVRHPGLVRALVLVDPVYTTAGRVRECSRVHLGTFVARGRPGRGAHVGRCRAFSAPRAPRRVQPADARLARPSLRKVYAT